MKTIIALIIVPLLLSGCATPQPRVATMYPLPRPGSEGVYHKVLSGETLWRIAKSYNIEISKIAQANRLPDPSKIETSQLLFIPGAEKKAKVSKVVVAYRATSKAGFIWPVKGKIVSYFGQKKDNTVNRGIDILTSENASVVASKDGAVSFCDDKVKGFGKTIIIDHGNGHSTVYAYNSQNLVNAGDRVKKGAVIAKAGKSSRSNIYTLHFEIRVNEKAKNPFYYLP